MASPGLKLKVCGMIEAGDLRQVAELGAGRCREARRRDPADLDEQRRHEKRVRAGHQRTAGR